MLKIENLDVYYGHVHALRGINLEIGQGELVALLGSNGAGKSTTLMSISGILKPKAGKITFEEADLARESSRSIVQRGIVQCPEGRRIFGGLSVLENLRMGAMRRNDRSNLEPDLERVFSLFPILGQRKNQSGSTLSGGEQQMLAIGRSLMAMPRLLMLDEPSLGLAPIIVEEIFNVIRNLHKEGVTILLVEQNARQALEIADRCYVLETGRVVLSGTGAELKANPKIENYYLGGSAG
jgi:branched-chain amino acid transport system ATP-binding protein